MRPQLLALMATAFLQAPASGQAPASAAPFVLKQLAPGVYAAIDGPEHRAGSNAGVVIGDGGGAGVGPLLPRGRAKGGGARAPRPDAKADPLCRQHPLSRRSHR